MLMKEKYALTFLCLYLECPSLASTGCSGSAPPPPATRLPYRALPSRRLALPPLPELWLYVCSSSYHLVFWFVLSDSCTRMPSPWGQGQALTLLAHTETPVQHPVYCTEDPSVSAKGMVRITEGWCLYWGLFLFRFKIQSLNLLWLGLRYLWPPQLPAEASFLGWVWMYTPAQGRERGDKGPWELRSSQQPAIRSSSWLALLLEDRAVFFGDTCLWDHSKKGRGVLRGNGGTFVFFVIDGPRVDASLSTIKVNSHSPPYLYWWPSHVFLRLGKGGCGYCYWGIFVYFISADIKRMQTWKKMSLKVHWLPLYCLHFLMVLEVSTPATFFPLPCFFFFFLTLLWYTRQIKY